MDSRRDVDFSVSSSLYLLVGQNGDFQVPYVWNWKLVTEACLFLLLASSKNADMVPGA